MPEIIEIGVPIEEIAARQERVAAAKRFEEPDRVPVWPAINYRYLLPMVGGRLRDYYTDPETMLRSQILGQKWLMEHVKTDHYAITGAWVGGWTDFQNTTEASSLRIGNSIIQEPIKYKRWARTRQAPLCANLHPAIAER